MKQIDIDKINTYLQIWDGANAFINTYKDDCDRLVIGFVRPNDPLDFIGISFVYTEYIAGPTRWSNCKLRCNFCELEDGEKGLELRDVDSNFLLRFAGAVVFGNGELIVPGN